MISPKNSSKKVIITALITNPATGSEPKSSSLALRNAASRTTAIFTELFATSIVLKSFSGLL